MTLSQLRGAYYGYTGFTFQTLVTIACRHRDARLLFHFFSATIPRQSRAVYPVPYVGDKPRITDCKVTAKRGDTPAGIVFTVSTTVGELTWNCIDAGQIVCIPLSVESTPIGTAVREETTIEPEPPPPEEGEGEGLEELDDITREELAEFLGVDKSEVEKLLREAGIDITLLKRMIREEGGEQ